MSHVSQPVLKAVRGGSAPATQVAAVTELGRYLADLHARLKELVALTDEKLSALKRADVAALDACAIREQVLVKDVLTREEQRNAILARVAQCLPSKPRPGAGLTEIADLLPEPAASALRARSVALRGLATELQRKNRIAADVARNLQTHIRGIFAEVAKAAQESVVYGSSGQHELSSVRRCVDAVG